MRIGISARKLDSLKALRVYKHNTNGQLFNSILVCHACTYDSIVDNAETLYNTSKRLLGKKGYQIFSIGSNPLKNNLF